MAKVRWRLLLAEQFDRQRRAIAGQASSGGEVELIVMGQAAQDVAGQDLASVEQIVAGVGTIALH